MDLDQEPDVRPWQTEIDMLSLLPLDELLVIVVRTLSETKFGGLLMLTCHARVRRKPRPLSWKTGRSQDAGRARVGVAARVRLGRERQ